MKIKLVILFLIVVILLLKAKPISDSSSAVPDLYDVKTYKYSMDLDGDGINEQIEVKSQFLPSGDEQTAVYMNGHELPELALIGYFVSLSVQNIDNSKDLYLEVETLSGKTINSLIYHYDPIRLFRVPVSTETTTWGGIMSRESPEFKDVDGDGILEMLAYYRHFPPDKSRTVEVYKFIKNQFQKVEEYEEKMPDIYL